MKSKRDEEINKSILEYLLKKNFQNSALAFMSETNLKTEDATKGNKLDKKWGTIISLQKKILDLETNLVQLKEDLENGMNPNKNQSKKNLDSIGLPKSISKVTLRGHRKEITCLAFHPFYKKLASSSEDASIIIWECDDFSQDKSVKAHSNTINHITFDNNGKFLGSCSSDLSIKIWNFENMNLFKVLNGHDHTVSFIEFSPDSNYIFSASRDKSIKYWEISTGNCKKTIYGHSEWVRCVSVNNKGNLLASSSDDESIIIWQINNNFNQLNILTGHSNKIEIVIFLKNETSVFNIFSSDYVQSYNKNLNDDDNFKMNEKKVIKDMNDINKEYLLSGSRDKLIMLWDVIGGICVKIFSGHDNWVRNLCEHPSGKYFVSCSDDKSVRIWDLKNGLCQKKLSDAHESFVVTVAMSSKCKILASGSNDLTIKIWDCS